MSSHNQEHERLIQEQDAAKQAWLHCILPKFCAEKKHFGEKSKPPKKLLINMKEGITND